MNENMGMLIHKRSETTIFKYLLAVQWHFYTTDRYRAKSYQMKIIKMKNTLKINIF